MRIAFVGKGGSGKTTLTAAFLQLLQETAHPILALDADVNVHLQEALEIEANVRPIGDRFSEIASDLEGGREIFKRMGFIPAIGTLPPTLSSTFLRCQPDDAFLKKYSAQKGKMRLLTVGTYEQADHGNACYHSKLTSLELIVHRVLDRDDEYVVADVTAGTDPISTSLIFAYDLLVCVVEPTQKSIDVFLDLAHLTRDWNMHLIAIGNKVQSATDEAFLTRHLPAPALLGSVMYSPSVSRFEQGREASLHPFLQENHALFSSLLAYSKGLKRDWTRYLARLQHLYVERCHTWYNAYYGRDLTTLIDPLFTYEQVLTSQERPCIV